MNATREPLEASPHNFIQVRGARQHNLRNVDVDIPRNRLIVVTGLSGSGKSSLAFDTIFAEGQRKYVESLSVHARQFLDQLPKPDVDRIDGLCPTLAIEQRSGSSNPRSTVATATEIYDFLRVLFARVGTPTCWQCGKPITRTTTARIVDEILAPVKAMSTTQSEPWAQAQGPCPVACEQDARMPKNLEEGTRFMVLAPLAHRQRGSHVKLLAQITRQGFVRARIDGEIVHLEDVRALSKGKPHTIEAVVDRLAIKEGMERRVADSVEVALAAGDGRVIIAVEQDKGVFADSAYSTRFACADHPDVSLDELSPRLFSFNSPHGACSTCNGLGTVLEFDPELLVSDPKASLAGGALATVGGGVGVGKKVDGIPVLLKEFCESFNVSPGIPYHNIPADLSRILMHGTAPADVERYGATFAGLLDAMRARWEKTESETVKQRMHAFLSEAPCTRCGGGRLVEAALAVKIEGFNIAEMCRLSVADALKFFNGLRFTGDAARVADPILREVRARLLFMCDVGVEYLNLDRASATLSGGEAQRIRLATQIGSGLVGVCYVLDEPTIGLHQRDSRRLVATLQALTCAGNTVIVVEHDEETIAAAQHVVDVGPRAGVHGGRIVAEGTLEEVLACPDSITAQYFTGQCRIELPKDRRAVDSHRQVSIHKASANNLKDIDVAFPLGCFICVTGVSGSGKSTLVSDLLLRTLKRAINGSGRKPGAYKQLSGATQVDRVIDIDQSPIGRSPRSNAATYVGAFDLIRQLFAQTREAKVRGYSPARFSFNVKGGRCEDCQGQGTRRIEMHFLPDVFVDCATCEAARYNRETLEVRYRGHSIADVLNMRVEDAERFFANFPKIHRLMRALLDVGLGYISLGQSSVTLSGGEAQRVKLAAELGRAPIGHTMYILDEPTTGLHLADVHHLVGVLNRLVDLGHTMVVIEHNLEVIKMADWVIDLGPEGGDGGGEVVVCGPPEAIVACERSYTGRYLAPRLAGTPIMETVSLPSPLCGQPSRSE